MVVNAPTSNIVSAAELAVGADARRRPPHRARERRARRTASGSARSTPASSSTRRPSASSVSAGSACSSRSGCRAFGMKVIAYDPYVQAGRAAQMGVRLVDLDELLAEADFMSVHLPKTPETVGLIGDEELAKVKPSLVLVNAARGGIVDEHALYAALKEGRIAAAGIDVFATEPCTDSPLFEFENVVATPHLGASTDEAQEKAGIAVARSVRLALSGELVPDAVNVQGGVIAEDVRPGIPLTEKLGRIFTALAGEVAQQLDVEVRGEITEYDVKVLELAALKGVFADIVEDQVSYVNAPLLAAERGLAVRLVTDAESPDHRNLITLRGTLADGTQVSVQRHADRHRPAGAAGRGRRLRRRHRADRPPGVLPLRGPPGHGRHRRPHPRRRRRQHRRHAGLPRHAGAMRWSRCPSTPRSRRRRARRDQGRDRRHVGACGRPHRG